MLSLLNTVPAPSAAAAQGPGFAARGDAAADGGGGEFAKALERSNSSWKNQAPADSPARADPPAARSRNADGSAPAAQDSSSAQGQQDATNATHGGSNGDVNIAKSSSGKGTTSSTATNTGTTSGGAAAGERDAAASAETATDETTAPGSRLLRTGLRRGASDARQTSSTFRPRSESRPAQLATDAGDASAGGKAAAADDPRHTTLDEDISLAAGLTPLPLPNATATPEATAPSLPALALLPTTDGQAPQAAATANIAAAQEESGAVAIDAAAASQRSAPVGIATTALASSYSRQPALAPGKLAPSNPAPVSTVAAPATGVAEGLPAASSPTTSVPAATTAVTAVATNIDTSKAVKAAASQSDPRSTSVLAKALAAADRDNSTPRASAGSVAAQVRELRNEFIDRRAVRPLPISSSEIAPDGSAASPAVPTPVGAQAGLLTPDVTQTTQAPAAAAQAQAQAAATPVTGMALAPMPAPTDNMAPAADSAAVAATLALPTGGAATANRSAPGSAPGSAAASTAASRAPAGGSLAPTDTPAVAGARGDASGRTSSVAADAGTDSHATRATTQDSRRAADGRPARNDTEASTPTGSGIASTTVRPQSDDSGRRSDTQRDNSGSALSANTSAGAGASQGSGGPARFAEQLQSLLPAGAIAAPAPQLVASAPAAPVLTAQLSPSLYSPDFAPAMGAQVTLFARDGVHHARIELNPAEMGPISVKIEMQGSGARVDFQAEQAGTRQVIEASLPALASALRDAGMTLTGGGVFQPEVTQASNQGSSQNNSQQNPQNSAAFGNNAGGLDSGQAGNPGNGQSQNQGSQRSAGQHDGRGFAADDGKVLGSSTVRLAAAQRGLVDLVA